MNVTSLFHSLLSVALLSGLALAVPACGKAKLDPAKIEGLITTSLKARDVTLKSVKCPEREIKAGDTFDCDGVTDGDEKTAFKVTQKDDTGTVSVNYGHLMNQQKVGEHLVGKLGAGAELKCPNKSVVLKKGATFVCDLKTPSGAGKFEITAKDDDGNVHGKSVGDAKVAEVDDKEAD